MIDIAVDDHGELIVISIKGEFYIESIQYAESVWEEQVVKHPRVIGINCQNIKFIDSSAIGILVKFLNNAMAMNIELVFFDLSNTLINVFKTARLGNFFKVMEKEDFEKEYLKNNS
ncbi:MAG TPA: STAS domain-containing protein [Spirochaetota bacterium]|nr:STAS domain-containing protein [Spirochaetota bacterium]HPI88572.1 STAS domain-containing protein [Spirochaetota bacterium]HPR48213.1 STAS domain-containing protein [Spirochaetota bacterium]